MAFPHDTHMAAAALNAVMRGEGATIDQDGCNVERESGYAVALGKPHAAVVDMPRWKDDRRIDRFGISSVVLDFVHEHREMFRDENLRAYLGVWVDDDKIYLDIVRIVSDRGAAVRLGRLRNQISVWDFANNCEIPTGGTGTV